MSIQLNAVSHHFGELRVLADISLSLQDGEILCVLGPSGSGKSTLLRIIAGLEPMQSGDITLDSALMANSAHCPPPEQRPIGLVFQDHALFPHLTVAQNVAFGLGRLAATQRDQIVEQLLNRVGLAALAQRYPHTLSGGQQKFVAFARALMVGTKLLMLDEPSEGIAPVFAQRMVEIMANLKEEGESVLVAESNDKHIKDLLDRTFVIERGSIINA